MLTTVLFDLDGTLLPMDQDVFTRQYFSLLAAKLAPLGYEPKALIAAIMAGTAAMVRNDGVQSNESVFWRVFAEQLGSRVLQDRAHFDDFYRNDFQQAKACCGRIPGVEEVISDLRRRGYQVVLATNPIFPSIATQSRIRWAGLEPEDFPLITTYENIGFCKPNPAYYEEILRRAGCRGEHCLMVGNDVAEDMVARETGAEVFLLMDCLINKGGCDISQFPHGDFAALSQRLSSLPAIL